MIEKIIGVLLFMNVIAVAGRLLGIEDLPWHVWINLLGCVVFGVWLGMKE